MHSKSTNVLTFSKFELKTRHVLGFILRLVLLQIIPVVDIFVYTRRGDAMLACLLWLISPQIWFLYWTNVWMIRRSCTYENQIWELDHGDNPSERFLCVLTIWPINRLQVYDVVCGALHSNYVKNVNIFNNQKGFVQTLTYPE